MQLSSRRLTDMGGVVNGVSRQLMFEDGSDPLAYDGVVAITRQIDQAGEEPPIAVSTDEQPQLPPISRVHNLRDDRQQLGNRGLEELVARVSLQDVEQGLAVMAAQVEASSVQERLRLLTQERDPSDRLGVGRRAEQAQEASLAIYIAVFVETFDSHVVQVHRAMHGGAGVCLGEHQEFVVSGMLGSHRWQHLRTGRVSPQDAIAGAWDSNQMLFITNTFKVIFAKSQEGEMVITEPLKQRDAPVQLVGGHWRWILTQVRDDQIDLLVHP